VRVLAAALVLCLHAKATTVVAIWTPEKLVITGDSLLNSTWTGANGQPHHQLSTGCKIHQYGSNYISAAGNYHIQKAGFDVWESAIRACGGSVSVDQCAANFKAELRGALARIAGVHDVHLTVIVAGPHHVGLRARRKAYRTIGIVPQGPAEIRTRDSRRSRRHRSL
jgi:hypothetical protein